MSFVQIFDPADRTWTTLNERNKEAQVNPMPMPSPPTPEQQARMAELRAKAQAAHVPTSQASENIQAVTHRSEASGTRIIAGVAADGRRTTRIIPVGMEGNDRDLTIVNEVWTSPELHPVLERTTEDPRSGKSTMLTTSLERASPDPALFQIPADYKVTRRPVNSAP